MEKTFAYCCEAFAEQAMKLQAMAGGGFAYPTEMRPSAQFEPDSETDTWNINGCCGGGCYVVSDMRFCPYCGTRLLNPMRSNGELSRPAAIVLLTPTKRSSRELQRS